MKNFILTLLALLACSPDKQKYPTTIELRGTKIEMGLICPYELRFVEDYLLVFDDCTEKLFHVFDADTYMKIGSFGEKNDGPKGYGFPYLTGQVVNLGTEILVGVIDIERNIVRAFDIDRALKEEGYDFSRESSFRDDLGLINQIYYFADSSFFATQLIDPPGKAFIHRNDTMSWIPYGPSLDFSVPRSKAHVIYGSRIAGSGEEVVLAMDIFRRIEKYNSLGELLKENNLDTKRLGAEIVKSEDILPLETVRHYNELKVYETGLLALDYNMTYEAYAYDQLVKTRLDFFSEELELLKTFQFDQRIVTFDLSPDRTYLLGIAEFTEERDFVIFKYDLQGNAPD